MYFIDHQNRFPVVSYHSTRLERNLPPSQTELIPGLLEDLSHIGRTGTGSTQLAEVGIGGLCNQSGECPGGQPRSEMSTLLLTSCPTPVVPRECSFPRLPRPRYALATSCPGRPGRSVPHIPPRSLVAIALQACASATVLRNSPQTSYRRSQCDIVGWPGYSRLIRFQSVHTRLLLLPPLIWRCRPLRALPISLRLSRWSRAEHWSRRS